MNTFFQQDDSSWVEDLQYDLVPVIPHTQRSASMDFLAYDAAIQSSQQQHISSNRHREPMLQRPLSGCDSQRWESPERPNKTNSKSMSNMIELQNQNNVKKSKSKDMLSNNKSSQQVSSVSPTKVRFKSPSKEKNSKLNGNTSNLIPPKSTSNTRNQNQKVQHRQKNDKMHNKENVSKTLAAKNRRYANTSDSSAWVESNCGIVHTFIIATSLLTTIPLAIMSSQWEMHRRTCPLFVAAIRYEREYWGNPNMSICYLCAYLPLILLVSSLCLSIFHGSVLHSLRTKGAELTIVKSRSYAVIMTLVNILELVFAIGIAAFLTDGFRQTCLSFELVPWETNQPATCLEGYRDRDDIMFVGNTFNRVIIGMVGAWLSVLLLFESTIIFLWKTRICSV